MKSRDNNKGEHISVFVRIRPFLDNEQNNHPESSIKEIDLNKNIITSNLYYHTIYLYQ